jgi:arylsulfatase A-like enzyme
MREINIGCLLLSTVGGPFGLSYSAERRPVQNDKIHPNVLIVLVDDWGAKDMSFSGSAFYETPNLDKLGQNSFSFSQGYVAYPRSVPSRFSLWTGMHCARPQLRDGSLKTGDERKIDENTYCMAEPFKASGYNTFFIGKWHLSTETCMPENKGFDINIGGGFAGLTISHFFPFNGQNGKGRSNKHSDASGIIGMDDGLPNEYLTDYMTRKVVDYIKLDHLKPFMAVCAFYAVHTPLEAKAEIIEKYIKKKEQLGLTENHFIHEEAGVRKAEQNNEVYAAMIESVDIGVGKMIQALKEKGLYDNTIIVLTSDNGGLSNRGANNNRELATCNDPLKAGKGHLYEGGIRVPFIIHMPGQEDGRKIDTPIVSYDLLPTLTDLCKVPVKSNVILDGVSIIPLMVKGDSKGLEKRKIYWHKASERPNNTGDYVSTAVRSGDYKLIDFYAQNRVELYNLKEDPSETKNLVLKEPKITADLMKNIAEWRADMKVYMFADKQKNKKVMKVKNDE